MKNVILLFILVFSLSASAQFNEIKEKLDGFQVSSDILTENLKDADATHFYNVKTTIVIGTDTKVELSHFDPALAIGNRWVLNSVNGNAPSTVELEAFDKSHNTKHPNINGSVDNSSWKIIRDNDTYIMVGFRYNKQSLPKKYKFLGDCYGYAYFNKATKLLEKTEFSNTAPLHIKSLDVSNLDMVIHYNWNAAEEAYFISKEELIMAVNKGGLIEVIKETSEYSNYSKL